MCAHCVLDDNKVPLKKRLQLTVYFIYCSLICFAGFTSPVLSQEVVLDVGQDKPEPRWLALPYVFYSDSLEVAYGIAGGTSGYVQDQMALFGTFLGTSNNSYAGYLYINDFQIPFLKRLFIDLKGSYGYFTDQRAYVGVNPDFPGERAGSNESSNENFFTGEGKDNWIEFTFRYVLPIGHAKKTSISRYVLDRGLLHSGAAGGSVWNPLKSGRTYIDLTAFARERDIDNEVAEIEGATNGLQLALEYDNRDFKANPSKGSLVHLGITRDFGKLSSSGAWTFVEGDFRKYLSLRNLRYIRQQMLAFRAWTAETPTWRVTISENDTPITEGRPPPYLGASLGGFERLKAYPMYRFSDKSAIYYAIEYRLIPHWHPLGEISWLKFLNIDWWQLVPFAEVGRVAPEWSFTELHSDMKWDVGLGIRFMAKKAVFRVDTAFTSDNWSAWAMVGQSF